MTTTDTENRRARARTADPFTSHTAARVATRSLPTHRDLVLAILTETTKPMTHEQIIATAARWRMTGRAGGFTEQSLRSRCHELERDGLVVAVPDERGRSRAGNPASLYIARSVYETQTNDYAGPEQGELL